MTADEFDAWMKARQRARGDGKARRAGSVDRVDRAPGTAAPPTESPATVSAPW